jgi:hypothetical protein
MSFARKLLRVLVLVAPFFITLTLGSMPGMGDEPGRLGRLFRFGGNPTSSSMTEPRPSRAVPPASGDSTLPALITPGSVFEPGQPTAGNPVLGSGAATGTATPRLIPHSRVSRAVTDADPIVTRVTLGRSDDGTQFGMFLQVFADGTVIDSEGVHQVSQDGIKPVTEALESSELFRGRGHCGSPPTDFIEQVHVVVYERSFGRLRANSFSFSGNPQGCDHAVRRLQAALDAVQLKTSRQVGTPSANAPSPAIAPAVNPGSNPIRLNEEPNPPVSSRKP